MAAAAGSVNNTHPAPILDLLQLGRFMDVQQIEETGVINLAGKTCSHAQKLPANLVKHFQTRSIRLSETQTLEDFLHFIDERGPGIIDGAQQYQPSSRQPERLRLFTAPDQDAIKKACEFLLKLRC